MSNAPSGHSCHGLVPAGREFLKRRSLCPGQFTLADLPTGKTDLSQTKNILPLAIAVADYGAVIFTAAARSAYEGGNVSDWWARLCQEAGFY